MRVVPSILAIGFFAAIFVVPTASAQASPAHVTVFTEFSDLGDERLRPESESLVGSVWATIQVPAYAFCLESVPALFSLKMAPAYASVLIMEPIQYVEVRPDTSVTTHHVKTLVAVTTNREAPAFEDGLYSFAVEFLPPPPSSGCNVSPSSGYGQATIKNDYIPGVRFGGASSGHEGLSGWIDVPIENLANGPTRIRAVLEPANPEDFVLLNANDIVLESRATSGSESPASGVMRISYVLDGVDTSSIKVRFMSGHDLFESDQEIVEAVYQAEGTFPVDAEEGKPSGFQPDVGEAAALPGPSIPVLMLIGGIVLAMARRRHE